MDLYTDQIHLKRLIAGTATPAWTPLPVTALSQLDPKFCPGMGALQEHPLTGQLRCPLRGCGKWSHRLSIHLNQSHPEIDGVGTVRRLLDIPLGIPLESRILRERKSTGASARWVREGALHPLHSAAVRMDGNRAMSQSPRRRPKRFSLAHRNMADACDAQLAHQIIDLTNELRRAPVSEEYEKRHGRGRMVQLQRVYGSWTNALALCGLKANRPRNRLTCESILPGLLAWYEKYGRFPTANECRRATKSPRIPTYPTILRVFGVSGWDSAMQYAASLLNIYGGRYGLPERAA